MGGKQEHDSSRDRGRHTKMHKSSKRKDKERKSERGRSEEERKRKKGKDKDKKHSKSKSKSRKRDRDDDSNYSIVSGKKIKMKVHKSKDDKVREKTRQHMLEMLNSRF